MILAATFLLGLSSVAEGQVFTRNAITDPAHLWPNGVVPYVFHNAIDAYHKVHMLAGMKQVMLSTYSGGQPCVNFVPRTAQTDFIEIQLAGSDASGSVVGRAGGKQVMTVSQNPTQDEIVRTLLFVLGLNPEVARPDRDNFLDIVLGNIDAAYLHNFQIEQNTDTFHQPFDYNTIVMYGPYAFAVDRSQPTIKTKYDGNTIAQAVSMSLNDVTLVQHVYKCPLDSSHRIDIIGPFEFECHFHYDMCAFRQDDTDAFDWVLREGPTDTVGTGPNADHSSGSGSYALAEASRHHNQVARLITPTFSAGTYCFVMWVYAYGADVGQIRVIEHSSGGDKTLITVRGTANNNWYHGSTTFTSPNSQVFLRIEASIGNGDQGDIAIDDVYIYKGQCIDWF